VFASALAVLAAASPTVDAQVVDRAGRVVGPRAVAVPALRVRAGGRTCRLGAGLPIGVLRALKVPFRAEGSCSSLYVSEVRRQRERGAGGWVYKVGRRLPGVSASSTSARLRGGQQVTWYWCVRAGACQRTLATRSTASGTTLRTTVTSYDDRGRGAPVAGAQVAVSEGDAIVSSTTGADGTATATVASGRRYAVRATRRGMIPSFPEEIAVP
jgi:hypothetical protein